MDTRFDKTMLAIAFVAFVLMALAMTVCYQQQGWMAKQEATLSTYQDAIDERDTRIESLEAEVVALVDENARLASDNTSLVRQVEEQKQAPVGRTSEPAVMASAYEGDIPTLIRSISSARGVDAEGMVELAFRESSFNPSATNGSCKGLFQLSGDYPDWADPVANTHNAITYILGRYGSVSAALAHHDAKGWY